MVTVALAWMRGLVLVAQLFQFAVIRVLTELAEVGHGVGFGGLLGRATGVDMAAQKKVLETPCFASFGSGQGLRS